MVEEKKMIRTTNKSRREADMRQRQEPFKPQGTPRRHKSTRNMVLRAVRNKMDGKIIQAIYDGKMTKAQIYGGHPTK